MSVAQKEQKVLLGSSTPQIDLTVALKLVTLVPPGENPVCQEPLPLDWTLTCLSLYRVAELGSLYPFIRPLRKP